VRTLFLLLAFAATTAAQTAKPVTYEVRPHPCAPDMVIFKFSIEVSDQLRLALTEVSTKDPLMRDLKKARKFTIFSVDTKEVTIAPANKASRKEAEDEMVTIVKRHKAPRLEFQSLGDKPESYKCMGVAL
jgi:hypothetical protein